MHTDLVIDPTDCPASVLLDVARCAESVGFDGVWLYDHFSGAVLGGSSAHDPWTLLGAVANVTSRVVVGPLVANVMTRHPAALAVAAATLQDLSEGRAHLGLGAGAGANSPFARELTMVGIEPRGASARRAMVSEAIATIRRLWQGEADFAGEHFELVGAIGFPRPDPLPPILVGASGPRLTRVAAEVADGIVFHSFGAELEPLVEVARTNSGDRSPTVNVHAPMADEWLIDDQASRRRLVAMGVDRVMLAWRNDTGLEAVERAGQLIAS